MNSLVLTGKKASKDVASTGPYGLTKSPESSAKDKPLMFQSIKKASNTVISE